MSEEIIKLNVGGVHYSTTRSTLTRFTESTLGHMFTGALPTARDDSGCYFIDRDGQLFQYILNYLRCSRVALPANFQHMDQLLMEAHFYKIQPLLDALRDLKGFSSLKIHEEFTSFPHQGLEAPEVRTLIFGREDVLATLPTRLGGIPVDYHPCGYDFKRIKEYCDTRPQTLPDPPNLMQLVFGARLTTERIRMPLAEELQKNGWVLTHVNTATKNLHVDTAGMDQGVMDSVYFVSMYFKKRA